MSDRVKKLQAENDRDRTGPLHQLLGCVRSAMEALPNGKESAKRLNFEGIVRNEPRSGPKRNAYLRQKIGEGFRGVETLLQECRRETSQICANLEGLLGVEDLSGVVPATVTALDESTSKKACLLFLQANALYRREAASMNSVAAAHCHAKILLENERNLFEGLSGELGGELDALKTKAKQLEKAVSDAHRKTSSAETEFEQLNEKVSNLSDELDLCLKAPQDNAYKKNQALPLDRLQSLVGTVKKRAKEFSGSSDTKPGNDSVVSKEAYDALTAKMTAQENMNEKLLSDYKDMQADRERDKETIERLTAQLDKLRAERDAGKGKKKKH